MTDTPSPRSHHLFLFVIGTVGAGVVAYLTYTGLLLFRAYQQETTQVPQASAAAVNNAATDIINVNGQVTVPATESTEPLPIITNGWSTVTGKQRVRGTVIDASTSKKTLRIILDDAQSYPEATVLYTGATTVENVDTTTFDANGQPMRTVITANAIGSGDVIDIDTAAPITVDAATVTAAAIIRYQ